MRATIVVALCMAACGAMSALDMGAPPGGPGGAGPDTGAPSGGPDDAGPDSSSMTDPPRRECEAGSHVSSWARTAAGPDRDEATGVAILADGSLVLVGQFVESLALAGSDLVLSSGSQFSGGFVARFCADGTLLWAHAIAGANLRAVAATDGGVVVVGGLYAEVTLALGEPDETLLTPVGADDIIIAQYRSGGSLDWARLAGGALSDTANGVAVAADGSLRVAGYFDESATFGQGEQGEQRVDASVEGIRSFFVARYEPDGSFSWVETAGGDGSTVATAIATTPDGEALVAGSLADGEVNFGDGAVTLRPSQGWHINCFIARYAADGSLVWARGEAGQIDEASAIAAMPDGGAAVGGSFLEEATFGVGEPSEITLHAWDTAQDPFVARYRSDGTLAWVVRPAAGPASTRVIGVAASEGGLLTTGVFQAAASFDSPDGDPLVLGRGEGTWGWLARYEDDGSLAWARWLGGPGERDPAGAGTSAGTALSVAGDHLAVAGAFEGSVELPTSDGGGIDLDTSEPFDVFVLRDTLP